MNLNFFEKVGKEIEEKVDLQIDEEEKINNTKNISQEEIELAKKLDAIEEFTIDRFEGDKAILENRQTREMIDELIERLPGNHKEGDILKRINGKYIFDEEKTLDVEKKIENKMKNLWN